MILKSKGSKIHLSLIWCQNLLRDNCWPKAIWGYFWSLICLSVNIFFLEKYLTCLQVMPQTSAGVLTDRLCKLWIIVKFQNTPAPRGLPLSQYHLSTEDSHGTLAPSWPSGLIQPLPAWLPLKAEVCKLYSLCPKQNSWLFPSLVPTLYPRSPFSVMPSPAPLLGARN